jgi:superkiller protein 3
MKGVILAAAIVLLPAGSQTAPAPGTPMAQAAEARQAFAEGQSAMERGELALAAERFGQAARLAPNWGLAHLHRGIAAFTLDPDDASALASLERAVALDPNNARAHMHLGVAYEHASRFDDAARELRTALAQRSDLREARAHLAAVLALTGPAAEAIALYRAVLESDPTNLAVLSALAELYEATSQPRDAEAALVAIVRLFPAVPYHRYRLAQFYERSGQPVKARQAFAEIEQLAPRARKMRQLR